MMGSSFIKGPENFNFFLATRAMVGIGEASYSCIAPTGNFSNRSSFSGNQVFREIKLFGRSSFSGNRAFQEIEFYECLLICVFSHHRFV